MQVIIPMTGYGSRFLAAGYTELKPFIKMLEKPVLQWIVDGMYSKDTKFLFICRQEHLAKIPEMSELLNKICPAADIFSVTDWVKLGPVYDVLRATNAISDDEQCIINYCDFYMTWDYIAFLRQVTERGSEGAVPCYTGFHPHLLVEKNVYASCKVDVGHNLIEIREKFSFESDKLKSLHSPGVYYFKTGSLLKKYCKRIIDEKTMLNGEYYASMTYNNMVKDGLNVWCPANVLQFCQWGTPEDMRESEFWLNLILGAKTK